MPVDRLVDGDNQETLVFAIWFRKKFNKLLNSDPSGVKEEGTAGGPKEHASRQRITKNTASKTAVSKYKPERNKARNEIQESTTKIGTKKILSESYYEILKIVQKLRKEQKWEKWKF